MELRLGAFVASIFGAATLVLFAACGEDVYHQTATCQPACGEQGRECGSDGCGGICGECGEDQVCTFEGRCVASEGCVPDCSFAECGTSCGVSCGTCAAPTPICGAERRCVDCQPNCTNRVCGDDGCGGSCGTCTATTTVCDPASGMCVDRG